MCILLWIKIYYQLPAASSAAQERLAKIKKMKIDRTGLKLCPKMPMRPKNERKNIWNS
jgi:hypothetical protein